MFNLGGMFVQFEARTKPYEDALASIERQTKETGAKLQVQGDFNVSGGGNLSATFSGASASAMAMGAQIRAALAGAFAPLSGLGRGFAAQFNALGGTLVTMARRVDAAMKFPAINAAIGTLVKKLDQLSPSQKVIRDMSKYQNELKAMGQTGAQAFQQTQSALREFQDQVAEVTSKIITAPIKAYRGFAKFAHFLSSLGDPAKKTISKVLDITIKAPVEKLKQLAMGPQVAGAGQMDRALGRLAPTVNRGTAAVKRFGAELLMALGFFGLAFKAVNFFKKGISSAISLNETMSKTKEVFGDATAGVVGQADQMSKRFGMAKGALLDAASGFGLLGQAAGLSEQKSAGLANEMTKLAADATSFFNIPFEESLAKLKSGLVGESEPMRALGVLLSEEAVQAEAFRLGLAKSGKELNDQSKVIARASLIRQGLAAASGDLIRTEESAANQFRKLGGGIDNFATSIGELLYPAVQKGVVALNEFGASVIEAFEANKGVIQGFVDGISMAIDITGTLIRNWPKVWKIMELKVGEVVANIVAWVDTIPGNLAIVADYIGNNWYQLISDSFQAIGALFRNLGTNIGNFAYAIYSYLKDPTQGFHFEWTGLLDGFQATAESLPEMLKPALVDVQADIDKLAGEIADEAHKHNETAARVARDKRKTQLAAKEGKEWKSKTLEFAEFARKVRSDQLSKKDDATKKLTAATQGNTKALTDNTSALKAGGPARFA